jgi:protein MpaA
VFLFPILLGPVFAVIPTPKEIQKFNEALESRFKQYGWTDITPGAIAWESYRTTSDNNPLMFTQFGGESDECILFLGAVHGDELPTVYLLFKLAVYLRENPQLFQNKCIVIAPVVNPDGFFATPPTRINQNGVDLNRNLPTRDWNAKALSSWQGKNRANKRYYPGRRSGSEAETLFQIALIKRFKPKKILSVHSPLGFYDFDGPSVDLDSIEKWLDSISQETNHPWEKFGYFPGSLGNYAGHERGIFTLTLELPSSDPRLGPIYFQKFQPAFLKFVELSIEK